MAATLDDEATTGVAYEVHDAPAQDRATDRDVPGDRPRDAPAGTRRFARYRATYRPAPAEPMS